VGTAHCVADRKRDRNEVRLQVSVYVEEGGDLEWFRLRWFNGSALPTYVGDESNVRASG
jgi:hypothetical protein